MSDINGDKNKIEWLGLITIIGGIVLLILAIFLNSKVNTILAQYNNNSSIAATKDPNYYYYSERLTICVACGLMSLAVGAPIGIFWLLKK